MNAIISAVNPVNKNIQNEIGDDCKPDRMARCLLSHEPLASEFCISNNHFIWIFLFTGFTALIIAFIAILYHALKASRANPVKALRYE